MAQLINITSEALQATIRRLLPSQQGFGEDLQATNVVTPIIDLTPSAEGSELPQYLQQSLGFDDLTTFSAVNSTQTAASGTGFFRIYGAVSGGANAATSIDALLRLNNGLANKTIWQAAYPNRTDAPYVAFFDIVVFLQANHVCEAVSNDSEIRIVGVSRQVATLQGELVNPTGYTPQ